MRVMSLLLDYIVSGRNEAKVISGLKAYFVIEVAIEAMSRIHERNVYTRHDLIECETCTTKESQLEVLVVLIARPSQLNKQNDGLYQEINIFICLSPRFV